MAVKSEKKKVKDKAKLLYEVSDFVTPYVLPGLCPGKAALGKEPFLQFRRWQHTALSFTKPTVTINRNKTVYRIAYKRRHNNKRV